MSTENPKFKDIEAYQKQVSKNRQDEFFASLNTSDSVGISTLPTTSIFNLFQDFQNIKLGQELDETKVDNEKLFSERCAIINSDGTIFGVYPQNVPISDYPHPDGTTVVGIGSTYFTGSDCNVSASWKYTTESGFFNPNQQTESDYFEVLRDKRNKLLSESDWTQSRDVTLSNDAEWKTYRQALRDLPANTADPNNPTFPTKPS